MSMLSMAESLESVLILKSNEKRVLDALNYIGSYVCARTSLTDTTALFSYKPIIESSDRCGIMFISNHLRSGQLATVYIPLYDNSLLSDITIDRGIIRYLGIEDIVSFVDTLRECSSIDFILD